MFRKLVVGTGVVLGTHGTYSYLTTKKEQIHVTMKRVEKCDFNPFCSNGMVYWTGTPYRTGFHLWGGPYTHTGCWDQLDIDGTYQVTTVGADMFRRFGVYPKIVRVEPIVFDCVGSLDNVTKNATS